MCQKKLGASTIGIPGSVINKKEKYKINWKQQREYDDKAGDCNKNGRWSHIIALEHGEWAVDPAVGGELGAGRRGDLGPQIAGGATEKDEHEC